MNKIVQKTTPIKLHCTIQRALGRSNISNAINIPKAAMVQSWLKKAFRHAWQELNVEANVKLHKNIISRIKNSRDNINITIRWVDEAEMIYLNQNYRGFNKSTNVLSFVYEELPLGDIAICPAVVSRECVEFNQTFEQRSAHMVVHGLLHLMGMNHINTNDRNKMEELEVDVMNNLGYSNPFLIAMETKGSLD